MHLISYHKYIEIFILRTNLEYKVIKNKTCKRNIRIVNCIVIKWKNLLSRTFFLILYAMSQILNYGIIFSSFNITRNCHKENIIVLFINKKVHFQIEHVKQISEMKKKNSCKLSKSQQAVVVIYHSCNIFFKLVNIH